MQIDALSHLDHGLSPEHVALLLNLFASREGFFIETVEIPEGLPSLDCGLYGPIVGDPPIPDADVTMSRRGGREGLSRTIDRPYRPSRLLTVIAGTREDGGPTILYTAFGGPLAPREPWDPLNNETERAESKAFWAQHALVL